MTIKMKPLAQACAFALATGSLTMGNAIAAATPAGSTISNKITVTYQDASGNKFTGESNVINMTIREVRSAALTSGNGAVQEVQTTVKQVSSIHTLKNLGNVEETYQLTASNAKNDSIDATKMSIYLDKDGNGKLSAEELKAGPITKIKLGMNKSLTFIVVAELPAAIKAGDKLHITLEAKDSKGTVAQKTNSVTITFKGLDDNIKNAVTMPNGKGSSCNAYTWIRTSETWNNAKTKAASWRYKGQTGHLVTLTTAEENAFVASKFNARGGIWWIGGERSINSKAFASQWVTGEKFDYTNWNIGEPNNNNEKGLMFYDNGKWNDATTTTKMHYVVEFEMGACPELPKPKVEVTLTAAKDVACDGKADEKFGNVDMTKMASGECAIMHVRAKNTSKIEAKEIHLKQLIPDYASYVPKTISVCGWDDKCKLTPRTDGVSAKDTDYGYYDNKTGTVVIGGPGKSITSGRIIHGQYRLKID
jgi:hypothetical protein